MPISDTLRLRAEWGDGQTTAGLGQIETGLRRVDQAGKAAAQGTTQAAQSMTGMQRAGQILGGTLSGLFAGYLGYRGVRMLIDFGVEAEHLTRRASAASIVLAGQLAPASGGVAVALERMRAASLNTVPDVTLLARAGDAMRRLEASGVGAGKGFEFVAAAQKYATLSMLASGRDAAQTFEMLVAGVAKGQARYLETIGIMIDQHRLLNAEMTDSQRAAVLLDLTMAAMAREFKNTGAEIAKTKSWIDEIGTAWTNFKTAFGEMFGSQGGPAARLQLGTGGMSESVLRGASILAARRGVTPAEDPFYQELLARGRDAIDAAARAAAVAEVEANAVRDAAAKLAAELKKAADAVAADTWLKASRALGEFTYGLHDVAFRMAGWLPVTGPGLYGGKGFAFPTGSVGQPLSTVRSRWEQAQERAAEQWEHWETLPDMLATVPTSRPFTWEKGLKGLTTGAEYVRGEIGTAVSGIGAALIARAIGVPLEFLTTRFLSGLGKSLGIFDDASRNIAVAAEHLMRAGELQTEHLNVEAILAKFMGRPEKEVNALELLALLPPGVRDLWKLYQRDIKEQTRGTPEEIRATYEQAYPYFGVLEMLFSDMSTEAARYIKEHPDILRSVGLGLIDNPEAMDAVTSLVDAVLGNTDALKALTDLQSDVYEAFSRASAAALMLTERSEWGRAGVWETYQQGGGIGGAVTGTPGWSAYPDIPPESMRRPPILGHIRPARFIIEIHSGGDVVEQMVDASQNGRVVIDRNMRLAHSRSR